MVNVFNPGVVVIGGGGPLAGDRLFVPLRSEVKRRAFKPAVDVCRILPGALPGTAGARGGAPGLMPPARGEGGSRAAAPGPPGGAPTTAGAPPPPPGDAGGGCPLSLAAPVA